MMTTVEVRVSQQDELSVISDTEILSELRLNDLQEQGMLLPPNHTKNENSIRYSTATIDELEKSAAAAMRATSEALAATASSVPQVQVPGVPGFERQMLQDHM